MINGQQIESEKAAPSNYGQSIKGQFVDLEKAAPSSHGHRFNHDHRFGTITEQFVDHSKAAPSGYDHRFGNFEDPQRSDEERSRSKSENSCQFEASCFAEGDVSVSSDRVTPHHLRGRDRSRERELKAERLANNERKRKQDEELLTDKLQADHVKEIEALKQRFYRLQEENELNRALLESQASDIFETGRASDGRMSEYQELQRSYNELKCQMDDSEQWY